MLAKFKPGQSIQCTVTKTPRAAAGRKTLERLMRMDPETKLGLRKAHKTRAQTTIVFNRGNRDWVKRQTCGKLVRVVKGASWKMPFDVNVAKDIASVADCLTIAAA